MKYLKTFNLYNTTTLIKESSEFVDTDELDKVCEILDENLVEYDYESFSKFYELDVPVAFDIEKWLIDNKCVENWTQSDFEKLANQLEELFDSLK